MLEALAWVAAGLSLASGTLLFLFITFEPRDPKDR